MERQHDSRAQGRGPGVVGGAHDPREQGRAGDAVGSGHGDLEGVDARVRHRQAGRGAVGGQQQAERAVGAGGYEGARDGEGVALLAEQGRVGCPPDQHLPGGECAVEGQLDGPSLGQAAVEGESELDGLVLGHPGGLADQARAGRLRLLGGDGPDPTGNQDEEGGGEEQAGAVGASAQGNGAPSTSRPAGSGRKPNAS